jgi:hypothetical protein
MRQDRIEDGLMMVREADSGLRAPEYLEDRLRAAHRRHHGRPARGIAARWWLAGAAAACAAAAVWSWTAAAPARVEAPSQPAPIARVEPQAAQPQLTSAVQESKPVRRAATKKIAPPAQPRDIEFTALPYAPPLLPYDQGQIIRVRVPRQSLRSMGVSLSPDRVMDQIPAEILMGEDGIARGIRFVRSSEMQ